MVAIFFWSATNQTRGNPKFQIVGLQLEQSILSAWATQSFESIISVWLEHIETQSPELVDIQLEWYTTLQFWAHKHETQSPKLVGIQLEQYTVLQSQAHKYEETQSPESVEIRLKQYNIDLCIFNTCKFALCCTLQHWLGSWMTLWTTCSSFPNQVTVKKKMWSFYVIVVKLINLEQS